MPKLLESYGMVGMVPKIPKIDEITKLGMEAHNLFHNSGSNTPFLVATLFPICSEVFVTLNYVIFFLPNQTKFIFIWKKLIILRWLVSNTNPWMTRIPSTLHYLSIHTKEKKEFGILKDEKSLCYRPPKQWMGRMHASYKWTGWVQEFGKIANHFRGKLEDISRLNKEIPNDHNM